jgi:hypothetical protein
MLTKKKLRALQPGQWARVLVPDYECWRKPTSRLQPREEVNVCVIPSYQPMIGYPRSWKWSYRAAYRLLTGDWIFTDHRDGDWIGCWELGLIDACSNSPNWDRETYHEYLDGKGKWLYEPASDDPELCPGGDWSRYECDICSKFVVPFSDDDGNLLCSTCEVTGLVVDSEQLDRLEQVREFARSMGLSEQLERQLCWLAEPRSWGKRSQTRLGYDFAPRSYSFGVYILPENGSERKLGLNGGLIYQGPD